MSLSTEVVNRGAWSGPIAKNDVDVVPDEDIARANALQAMRGEVR